MYGGFEIMQSKLPISFINAGESTSSAIKPTLSPTPFSSAFSLATSRVSGKMSTATARQSFRAASVEIAMQPLPVQRSSMRAFGEI